MRQQFKAFYRLTKPGIIYGNILTATGGYLLASKGTIDWRLFAALLVGMSLVIGSACVFNNYIDRGIDAKMARTKKRALISGAISSQNAVLYATILGICGVVVLAVGTNRLVLSLGIIGFLAYVILYGFAKRRSIHGTLVGTISGATPIAAGYCAVTNRFDSGAVILFLIMVCWQMPHFYAIAMRRHDDYKAAGIPVLPVVKGMRAAKIESLIYIVAFIVALAALTVFGYAGMSYLIIMLGLAVYWLWKGIEGLQAADDARWARSMFGFSLYVVLALSIMLSLDSLLA